MHLACQTMTRVTYESREVGDQTLLEGSIKIMSVAPSACNSCLPSKASPLMGQTVCACWPRFDAALRPIGCDNPDFRRQAVCRAAPGGSAWRTEQQHCRFCDPHHRQSNRAARTLN